MESVLSFLTSVIDQFTVWIYYSTEYFIITAIIIVNSGAVVYLLIRILFSGTIKRLKEKHETETTEKLEDILTEFLSEEIDVDSASEKIYPYLTNRILTTKIFLNYFSILSGSSEEKIKLLVSKSGIEKYTLKELKDPHNPDLVLYIRFASAAQIGDAAPLLEKILFHSKHSARFDALCALIEISQFDALEFIYQNDFKLNEWEEMILLEKLLTISRPSQLNIGQYFHTNKEYMILLSLRLARHFNQFDLENDLKKLITHPSEKIRKNVYLSAAALYMNNLQHDLISRYEAETFNNKREIISALGKLGDTGCLYFLEQIFVSKTQELSLLAGYAISEITGSSDKLKRLIHGDEQLSLMINHISDPLI